MKDPLGVSPSKGNQETTRGKEKIILTSVGMEPTTSGLDLPVTLPTELRGRTEKVGDDLGGDSPPKSSPTFFVRLSWALHSTLIYTSKLILCSTICVHSATRHNIHI